MTSALTPPFAYDSLLDYYPGAHHSLELYLTLDFVFDEQKTH